VQHHASAIASFAVGAVTFAGCEVLTAGVGTFGCAALAGAAANGVSYALPRKAHSIHHMILPHVMH
jgi:large repetitive protein